MKFSLDFACRTFTSLLFSRMYQFLLLSLFLFTPAESFALNSRSDYGSDGYSPEPVLFRSARAAMSSQNCEETRRIMKDNVKSVLLLDTDKYPTSRPEIEKQCEISIEFLKNLKKYMKCLEGLQRQAFNVFANGFKKLSRTICSSEKKKTEAGETLSCVSADSPKGWNFCMDRTNKQLEYVAVNSTNENLLANLCCVYPQVVQCLGDKLATKKDCPHKNANAPRFFKNILGFVMKDSLELVCSQYKNNKDCEGRSLSEDKNYLSLANAKSDGDGVFLLTPIRKALKRLSDSDGE